MNSQTVGLRVAGAVFGFVCFVQLLRLVTQFDLVVATHTVPLWANAVVLVVAGALCYWMWRLSYRGSH